MKKKILYTKYHEKFDDFRKTIMDFFENIGQFQEELESLLTNNFQLLDAN